MSTRELRSLGRVAAAAVALAAAWVVGPGAASASGPVCKPPGFVKPAPKDRRIGNALDSTREWWAREAVDVCPVPSTCAPDPGMCVTEKSCYGRCLSGGESSPGASEGHSGDPRNPVPLPFVTVMGQGGMIQRGRSFLPGAGVQAAVHFDVSRYVVPYAEGLASFLEGNAFSATGGVMIGWRTHVRASFVGIDQKQSTNGSWVTTTTTTTTTWWDDERYPVLVGAQIGGGVFGMSSVLTDQGRLPEVLSPRIEVGPSLLGQHHVSALFTVDPTSGVVGMRGNVWLRLPFDFFWLALGMSYDVSFNPPATGGYDFIVTGALGGGFSTGDKASSGR